MLSLPPCFMASSTSIAHVSFIPAPAISTIFDFLCGYFSVKSVRAEQQNVVLVETCPVKIRVCQRLGAESLGYYIFLFVFSASSSVITPLLISY